MQEYVGAGFKPAPTNPGTKNTRGRPVGGFYIEIDMKYDPEIHCRRSMRLKGYNYGTTGAYFVTICAQSRECLFGDVVDGQMRLNELGQITQQCWHDLPNHYPHVELDAFVVMPNHVHGIILLTDDNLTVGTEPVGAGFKPAPTNKKRHGLPEIIRAFKTFSSRQINNLRSTPKTAVWQRNYFEHIIRNDEKLNLIRQYIMDNPLRWMLDRENPSAPRSKKEAPWKV